MTDTLVVCLLLSIFLSPIIIFVILGTIGFIGCTIAGIVWADERKLEKRLRGMSTEDIKAEMCKMKEEQLKRWVTIIKWCIVNMDSTVMSERHEAEKLEKELEPYKEELRRR